MNGFCCFSIRKSTNSCLKMSHSCSQHNQHAPERIIITKRQIITNHNKNHWFKNGNKILTNRLQLKFEKKTKRSETR